MKKPIVYFDLDGVLADFDNGVRDLCNFEPLPQDSKRPKGYDDILWGNIRAIERFYDKLDLISGAKEMFLEANKMFDGCCEILTGIPKPHRGVLTAKEDKISWVRRNLSDTVQVNVVYREEKINFCKNANCILVDDYYKNIREWSNAGGTGIHHKNARDTMKFLSSWHGLHLANKNGDN